jgi:hypothetical protein
VAGKAWDILDFLKNPPGGGVTEKNAAVRESVRQIDEPLGKAMENPRPKQIRTAMKDTDAIVAVDIGENAKTPDKKIKKNVPASAKRGTVRRGANRDLAEDSSGGELLGDIAAMVNKHKNRGMTARWKVKQMNQSSLVVEITVDLMRNSPKDEDAPE